MKLATLPDGSRDGRLVVVSRDRRHALPVPQIAGTLQQALDKWEAVRTALEEVSLRLNNSAVPGSLPLDSARLIAPLPRAYQWLDGSAYLHHVELARRARGAGMPDKLLEVPLMYQGLSHVFLAPQEPLRVAEEAWGIDFEAEVAVVTGDVPMGTSASEAGRYILLLALVNDWSLRELIPGELARGFGFLQSKPPCAMGPILATPDEFGAAWKNGRLSLSLAVDLNGTAFGRLDSGADMAFGFPDLIAHAARTRPLCAGTVLGGGTVSNRGGQGFGCIMEKRAQEKIETGAASTPYLKFGDRVRMELLDGEGKSALGVIVGEVRAEA